MGAGDLEMERSCGEVKFSRVLSMDMVFFLVGGEAVGETPVFLFPISVEDLFKEDGVSLSAGHGFLGWDGPTYPKRPVPKVPDLPHRLVSFFS